jgi:hypothetical protein
MKSNDEIRQKNFDIYYDVKYHPVKSQIKFLTYMRNKNDK